MVFLLQVEMRRKHRPCRGSDSPRGELHKVLPSTIVDRPRYQKLSGLGRIWHEHRVAVFKILTAWAWCWRRQQSTSISSKGGWWCVKRGGIFRGGQSKFRSTQEKLPRVAGSTVTLGCSKKRLSEKNTTCAGWRRCWSLGCDLNVLLPTPGRLSWLRPASIRHASAHKGSPAFRRRATGNEKQLPIGSLIILCKMIRLPIVWALKSVGHNTSVALRLRCFEPQQSPMCLWTRNSRVRRLRVWLEQGDTGRALKQVRTPFPELCVLWGWW